MVGGFRLGPDWIGGRGVARMDLQMELRLGDGSANGSIGLNATLRSTDVLRVREGMFVNSAIDGRHR